MLSVKCFNLKSGAKNYKRSENKKVKKKIQMTPDPTLHQAWEGKQLLLSFFFFALAHYQSHSVTSPKLK